jgi:hypothetical protein
MGNNEGIIVSGHGSITNQGALAVGQGARAENVTGGLDDVRKQADELLAKIREAAATLPGGPDTVTTAEATVEELGRPQPRRAVLLPLLSSLANGVGAAGVLAQGVLALEHAVMALI